MFATTACGVFERSRPPPLEGERIPVLLHETSLRPDPGLASAEVSVSPPIRNEAWSTAGGNASHALYHIALAEEPRQAWRTGVGRGASRGVRLLAQPVVDEDGRVFTLDVQARLTALDAGDGRRLWERRLPGDRVGSGTLGGGLAVADGKVFVTTGFAQVIALDASSGEVLWRQNVSAPIRSAPTVGEGRVFVVSSDNQTQALDAATGEIVWTHRGAAELASLLGAASPAYDAGTVVVAYSTGDLFALRAATGTELWSDYLSRVTRTTAVGQIADIRGSPVIDRGRVIAVSNAGRMAAFNLANGQRLWEQQIAGIQTPWVAGDYVYVVTTDGYLVCLSREDGRVRWIRGVPRYENPDRRDGIIVWSGPILAGDRLLLAGTNREIISVSPYSGDLLGYVRMPDGVSVPPAVARETLFILTDSADLIAWR